MDVRVARERNTDKHQFASVGHGEEIACGAAKGDCRLVAGAVDNTHRTMTA